MIYNIDPNLWGKHFWGIIHYITISYPNSPSNEHKLKVKQFFELFESLLPCENCRFHYSTNLKKYPLTDEVLSSKYKLVEWGVILHNEVNKQTGKKIITVDDAINIYLEIQNKDTYTYIDNKVYTVILLVVLIVVLIYYIKFLNK
jgi:hypothetical protein